MASSILTPSNSCDLTHLCTELSRAGVWSDKRVTMTTTPPPGATPTPDGFGIDPRLDMAATRVSAAFGGPSSSSRPQIPASQ